MAIYAVSLSALFGTSALYHRVNWTRPDARLWMRRLDHSMIFVLIAATYTPICLPGLRGSGATLTLVGGWAGATLGGVLGIRLLNLFTPQTLDMLTMVGFIILLGAAVMVITVRSNFSRSPPGVALSGIATNFFWT